MNLEERIQRMEDIHQIQNLMSRYEYWHTAGMHEKVLDMYAKKTPGVSVEIANLGIYEGQEGIRRFWIGANMQADQNRVGLMIVHTLTTPVIEVAGDGKTAKAIWISPGHETVPRGGKFTALWSWNKYGVDFVKEDGVWRFWHFHLYRMFKSPYDKSWVDIPLVPNPVLPDELKPDRPPTNNWVYSTTATTENIPAPPEPYDTWDESSAYVKYSENL
jgi:hypothetical protein